MEKPKNNGLTSAEVELSRKKHGANIMTKRRGKSLFISFLENLGDPVIRVLLISLVVNLIFTLRNIDWFETGGVVLAILVATTVSTLSERSSRDAFEKLSRAEKRLARVKRDGEVISIDSEEIVVGDLVLLSAGESVPADGILISGALALDQSALTGESKEMQKRPDAKASQNLAPDSSQSCLKGCLVSSGEGEMLVIHVGDASYLGGIVNDLQSDTRESPLKLRLSKLAKQISTIGYGAAVLIALLSLASSVLTDSGFVKEVVLSRICDVKYMAGEILRSITLGLTVVIMAVPEGLPMMIAVVLSSNVRRMLSDNVLVRKQTGIEAAGSLNLLFTDKTGTLTKGKMSVEGFILPNGECVDSIYELKNSHPSVFASFCANAVYNSLSRASRTEMVGGNATERALLDAAKKHIKPDFALVKDKLPFDSEKKYSSALVGKTLYFKGAPEILLPFSSGENFNKFAMEGAISRFQSEGKRVILMCESMGALSCSIPLERQSLQPVCAVIIGDPPRREAFSSVEALKQAGVGVVMITGDGLLTAQSIAKRVGIVNSSRNICLTHKELESMSDGEIADLLPKLAVLARALPSDKTRLVRIAQSKELVVGMTGDGINDAPSLKLSDVGFAMGSGSDVSREAGDVVILDDNLASVVKAVLYGRNIFKSIRKFLVFQLTVNFSSALVCMIAPLFGFDTPITVSQMLWVNMIMDTLGGLAFSGEAPRKRIMKERPKRRDEPIVNKYMIHQILVSGSFSALVSILFLKSPVFTSHFRQSENNIVLLSAFFGLFIFLGVMQFINSRTDRLNPFVGISKNPAFVLIMILISVIQLSFIYLGGSLLRATPLTPHELAFTMLCASLAVPFELIRKCIWRLSGHNEGF